jgi:hypothetical protein
MGDQKSALELSTQVSEKRIARCKLNLITTTFVFINQHDEGSVTPVEH